MAKTKDLKIETKEELKYVMDFYKIPFVPLSDGGWDLGTITKDMRYERPKGGGRRFRDGYEDMAFQLAFEQVKDVIKLKQDIDTLVTVTRTRFHKHQEWMYPDHPGAPATHHVYPITVTEEDDTEMSGTLREIFDNTHYVNDRLRYCNGTWHGFKDKDLECQYRLFLRMGWYKELPMTMSDTF